MKSFQSETTGWEARGGDRCVRLHQSLGIPVWWGDTDTRSRKDGITLYLKRGTSRCAVWFSQSRALGSGLAPFTPTITPLLNHLRPWISSSWGTCFQEVARDILGSCLVLLFGKRCKPGTSRKFHPKRRAQTQFPGESMHRTSWVLISDSWARLQRLRAEPGYHPCLWVHIPWSAH